MKIVKEHINEKFTEDSDPIKDLGIGEYPRKIAEFREILHDMWDKNYSKVIEDEIGNQDAWFKIEVIEDIQEELNKLFGVEK